MLESAAAEASAGETKLVRDLAIVRCLHDIGLRRGEAASTDVESLGLGCGSLAIVGKGKTDTKKLT